MHKILIIIVAGLLALAGSLALGLSMVDLAAAAPSCMSRQACIDSGRGYCRYTPTDEGRCWSTDRAFLKKVKKAGRSVRYASKPPVRSEPKIQSEPYPTMETKVRSEPPVTREPKNVSEPWFMREPIVSSEPYSLREPIDSSEPLFSSEPKNTSEPLALTETNIVSVPLTLREPRFVSAPRLTREPKRPSFEIAMIGVFTFASAFLGFNAAKILGEHPIYWGFPKLPPPPLDLANSPYRTMPAALPEPTPVVLDFGRFIGEAQRRVH